MTPLKVGDLVVIRYPSAEWKRQDNKLISSSVRKARARVQDIKDDVVLIEWEKPLVGFNVFVRSQVRKLRKRKRREYWVNPNYLPSDPCVTVMTGGSLVSSTRKEPGFIKVREVVRRSRK